MSLANCFSKHKISSSLQAEVNAALLEVGNQYGGKPRNKAEAKERAAEALEKLHESASTQRDGIAGQLSSDALKRYKNETEVDNPFILSHEAHGRDFANQDSQAARLLKQAREENTDRNVSFVKAQDYARENGITPEQLDAMTGGKPDDFGLVLAEGMKEDGRFDEATARKVRLDSRDFAGSKSRIDTDVRGVTLDAMKLTSEGMKRLPRVDGESNMQRTAKGFSEGLGAAMDAFSAKLKNGISDDTVIAMRNGERVTYGDVKKLLLTSDRFFDKEGRTDEQITKDDRTKELLTEMSLPEMRAINVALHKQRDAAHDKVKESLKGRFVGAEEFTRLIKLLTDPIDEKINKIEGAMQGYGKRTRDHERFEGTLNESSEVRTLRSTTPEIRAAKTKEVKEQLLEARRDVVKAQMERDSEDMPTGYGLDDGQKIDAKDFENNKITPTGKDKLTTILARNETTATERYNKAVARVESLTDRLNEYSRQAENPNMVRETRVLQAERLVHDLKNDLKDALDLIDDADGSPDRSLVISRNEIAKKLEQAEKDYTKARLKAPNDGEGRTEVGEGDNVHVAATAEDMTVQFGLDGQKITYANLGVKDFQNNEMTLAGKNKLNTLFNDMAESGTAIQRRIGEKGVALLDKVYAMDPLDQFKLFSVLRRTEGPTPILKVETKLDDKYSTQGDKLMGRQAMQQRASSPARIAEIVVALTDKYQDKAAYPHRFDAVTEQINAGGESLQLVLNRVAEAKDPARLSDSVKHLLKQKRNEHIDAAVLAANERIGVLLKENPGRAYGMQLKRSDEKTDATLNTPEAVRKEVEASVEKVLGAVKVEWTTQFHAGEFDPKGIIRISVHALDPMSVGHHESLHGFFKQLRDSNNHKVMTPLYRAADSAPVMNQLREVFKDQPEVLKQIEANKEERVAYMYQLWAQDKLRLGPETKTIFGKIKDIVLKTLGMWTNDARAENIMNYFHSGEYAKNMGDRNAVAKATLDVGTNKYLNWVDQATEPMQRLGNTLFTAGSARLRDLENPALTKLVDLLQPEATGPTRDAGFSATHRAERVQRLNSLAKGLRGLTNEDLEGAHTALKEGKLGSTAGEQRAVTAVRALLDDAFVYMQKAGVMVNDLGYGKNYFPRSWDADFISKNQDAFKAMLMKYQATGEFKGDINKVMNNLMSRDGSELGVVVDMPGMQNIKERKLAFIKPEDSAPFVQKSLMLSLNSYITQATRRAEWARRFGDDGAGMRSLLEEAKTEHGATQAHIDAAQDFIRGIDGTLGDDINPTARRMIGNMLVYQNVRLLPLAIFSSIVDPLGIVVRGGEVTDAFNAMKRGFLEIPRGFKKGVTDDAWYQLAQDMATIDDASLVHTLGTSFTQGMVSEGARGINDKFFRFNLMEQFTTSMRVSATEAASKFFAKHADGTSSEHSVRWLAELNLKPGEIVIKDGRPLLTVKDFEAHGYSSDKAVAASNKMRGAINQWVDGAILRPNAADRPIWFNDPHFAVVSHLKSFMYAFQHTILKRVGNELEHGNIAPAMALASYVPTMIAADLMKGMIQGGGEQPDWKSNWGVSDYVWNGVQRAGLLGTTRQFSTDFMKDVHQGGVGFTSLLGPTVEQGIDGVKTLAGRQQFGTLGINSLPANQLYKGMLSSGPTPDPMFVR